MLEGGFFSVLSINAPRGLRCPSDDVSNLPQAATDLQPQAAGARPFWLQMHALQGPYFLQDRWCCRQGRLFSPQDLDGAQRAVENASLQRLPGEIEALQGRSATDHLRTKMARPGFPLTTRCSVLMLAF